MSKEIKIPKKTEKKVRGKNLDLTASKTLAKALDVVGSKPKPKKGH